VIAWLAKLLVIQDVESLCPKLELADGTQGKTFG
jgi:hypothetical protein